MKSYRNCYGSHWGTTEKLPLPPSLPKMKPGMWELWFSLFGNHFNYKIFCCIAEWCIAASGPQGFDPAPASSPQQKHLLDTHLPLEPQLWLFMGLKVSGGPSLAFLWGAPCPMSRVTFTVPHMCCSQHQYPSQWPVHSAILYACSPSSEPPSMRTTVILPASLSRSSSCSLETRQSRLPEKRKDDSEWPLEPCVQKGLKPLLGF